MFDFLNSKLQSEECYLNHSIWNFHFFNQDSIVFWFPYNEFIIQKIYHSSFVFITFLGQVTKHVTNVEIQATNVLFTKKMFLLQLLLLPLQENRPRSLLASAFSSYNPACHPILVLMKQGKRKKLAINI